MENLHFATTPELLDRAKRLLGLDSDYKLAKSLKWPVQQVSRYRTGASSMSLVAASDFSQITGISLTEIARAARADHEQRRRKSTA